MLAVTARARLAQALIAVGDLDTAQREASTALDGASDWPSTQPTALGALALIAFRRCQFIDAVALADRGLGAGARGGWLRDGSILRVVRAEALHALGKREEAHATIREARDRVLRIAATLDGAALSQSYVTHIEANARTLELASEWLCEDFATNAVKSACE
jgi:hypothetical protein